MLTTLSPKSSQDEDDFILYQPNPTKQILLYDLASSSAVLSYIKMKNRTASIKNRTNAESISDDGRLPGVWARGNGNKLMSGFSDVYWFLAREDNYQPSLIELSYIDWVEANFLEAEMYLCWCVDSIFKNYTQNRFTHDLPWPIGYILLEKKKAELNKKVGLKYSNFEQFIESFEDFLCRLNTWIGNSRPEDLYESVKALVYGHISIMTRTSLNPRVLGVINKQRRILNLMEIVQDRHPA